MFLTNELLEKDEIIEIMKIIIYKNNEELPIIKTKLIFDFNVGRYMSSNK